MIYALNGTQLGSAYDKPGNLLGVAYELDGDIAFNAGKIRVMQYNVGGWYIGSGANVPTAKDMVFYDLQNGILANQNADILCIEEYWDIFSQTGRTARSLLSQYYRYIEPRNGTSQYYGHAICSKHPIKSYTQHTYTGDAQGRYYDEAVIEIGTENVHVFVTHLHPSDQSAKIAQATELCNYVKTLTDKFIVCGDFNSTLYDPFSETNAAIYNQFLNYGCTIANDGAFGIFPTACNSADWANDKFAIDNIICSSGVSFESVWTDLTKTTSAAVLETGKIDHIPLIADIEVSS